MDTETRGAAEKPTLKSLSERVQAVEDRVATVRETDPEARALSRCAQALDALPKIRRNGNYAYNSSIPEDVDQTAIARILAYLRLPDPTAESRRLAEDLERAQQRCMSLEHRLNDICGAVEGAS